MTGQSLCNIYIHLLEVHLKLSRFLDMCPKPNDTSGALSKKSHVEIFSDPVPALFTALMSEADTQERWITFTFPVDFYTDPYRPKLEKEIKYWTRKALCFQL